IRTVHGIAERGAGSDVQIVRGVECNPVRAGAVVLATGRFLGGGIRCEPDGRLRETVFDLKASAAGRTVLAALPNEQLFAERASGPHPRLAAGIHPDSDLRGGTVCACRAVLRGFVPEPERGGVGAYSPSGVVPGTP